METEPRVVRIQGPSRILEWMAVVFAGPNSSDRRGKKGKERREGGGGGREPAFYPRRLICFVECVSKKNMERFLSINPIPTQQADTYEFGSRVGKNPPITVPSFCM